MIKICYYQCSGCQIVFEMIQDEDSAGNVKYRLYPKCTCTDVYYEKVGEKTNGK